MIAIEMKKEKEGTFEELMEKANETYTRKHYQVSADLGTQAYIMAIEKEQKIRSSRGAGWACRFVGLEADAMQKDSKRDYYYEFAKFFFENILRLESDYIDDTLSAIKGLMLLPHINRAVPAEVQGIGLSLDGELARLYLLGEKEIERLVEDDKGRNHLMAGLLNSMGVIVSQYDQKTAEKIFISAFIISESKTINTADAMKNCAMCRLMLKNQAVHKAEKLTHALVAIVRLDIALEHYPADEVESRRNCKKIIADTRKEIQNNFE